jgi:hypothetical protein
VVRVPNSLDEAMSPEWLTEALSTRYPGVRVASVVVGAIDSRVSTNARFQVTFDAPQSADLPEELCLKAYFGASMQAARLAGEAEALFYRELASSTAITTLQSVYVDLDPSSGCGVIVTADVIAQGGSFLDPRDDLTAEQVARSLTQLARLHAATWGSAVWERAPWLDPRMDRLLEGRGSEAVRKCLASPLGASIPVEVRDAERVIAAYRRAAAESARAQPWTVLHGDAHLGNLFLGRDGEPAFLDWQLVQRGPWYIDVGYHVASSMGVRERRSSEQDLLDHYLDHLEAGGIDRPALEVAREGLKRGIAYGLFLWSMTSMVDPEVTAVLLHRLGSAAADHDALSTS